MAIFNLKVTPSNGRSAILKFEYIERINNFSWEKKNKYDDFLYSENCNMPLFAKENPIEFWKSAEVFERSNGNVFREIEFSLPHELSEEDNINLAKKFANEIFSDKYVYSLAIHSKPSNEDNINNIHCHIMFSERQLDGIERSPEIFFKRANKKNPEKGGAKKNREWHKYSKLYELRQTWERIANEDLSEKNLELISAKSLKNQRVDALLEENYLKAEMLDRNPINYDKKFIEFSTDKKVVEEVIEFSNYAKRIKKMKEDQFKILSTNFEIENEKARERFLKSYCEKEGKEYVPSNFDVKNNLADNQFNFENIFITSLENQVLINKKEAILKQINSLTNEDMKNRALKILTKNEYFKNLKKLEEMNNLYDSLESKDQFQFTKEKLDLETYFRLLENDNDFNIKLNSTIKNIEKKYEKSKELLTYDLNYLRNNKFKDVYLNNSPKNFEISKIFINESSLLLKDLKAEKEKLDKEVKDYKEILKVDYKEDLYKEINIKIYDKYVELKDWRSQLKTEVNNTIRLELENKILSREAGFKTLDIKYDIKTKFEKNKEYLRKEFKELRQKQDDCTGRIIYTSLMMKELKNLKEYKLLDKAINLENQYKTLESNGLIIDKIKYNIELENFRKESYKFDLENFNLKGFDIKNINRESLTIYSSELKNEIIYYKNNIKNISKQLSKVIVNDDLAKERILNKVTNGQYLKDKTQIKYYEDKIKNGKSIKENTIMLDLTRERILELEKSYKITEDDIKIEKQLMRAAFIELKSELTKNKEELSLLSKTLKFINKNSKIKRIKRSNQSLNISKSKLKKLHTGAIEFEDKEEKQRRRREWENSI